MFLPWELFKKSLTMHIEDVETLFKIRQTSAIYTKFQIIISEEELKIFPFIMHC